MSLHRFEITRREVDPERYSVVYHALYNDQAVVIKEFDLGNGDESIQSSYAEQVKTSF